MKTSIIGLLVAVFFSANAMAEESNVTTNIDWSLKLERQVEAQANTGELMGTMAVFGLDVSAGGLWNIDKTGEDFIDMNKIMLNASRSLSDNASVYIKNDFDTDWDRTESTIGLQLTF
jgi:hypothetical protein